MPNTTETPQKKVLFVDDAKEIRTVQADALRQRDIEVIEVTDGLEALNWLQENRTDLIITGIKMSNLGGFELMERLRVDPTLRVIPVFVFSHRGKQEDKERAFSLGAADFLVYGFATPNDIADTVKRFLGGKGTYHMKLDLRFLDGPNFRRDFKELIPPADNITVIVETDPTKEKGEFKMRISTHQ